MLLSWLAQSITFEILTDSHFWSTPCTQLLRLFKCHGFCNDEENISFGDSDALLDEFL